MSGVPASAALARVEAAVAAALDRAPDPIVLRFLVRAYMVRLKPDTTETSSDDLGRRLESALGDALQRYDAETATIDRARWLALFIDVLGATDDARIADAVERLTDLLSAEWPNTARDVEASSASVDACLRAASLPGARPIVPAAIDELERLVGAIYQPGRSLRSLAHHTQVASALLTAFSLTARIPYAMLGEELMQLARRDWWDDAQGAFVAPFEANCDASIVLRRLAALHRDPEYVAAAVVASAADYEGDARRMIGVLDARLPAGDAPRCARFGLALLER